MRIVVDALASTMEGGLATYVRGLLRGWAEAAPDDEVTVLLTKPVEQQLALDPTLAHDRLFSFPHRNPKPVWRFVRAEAVLPRFQRNADALLSTITTAPLFWRKPVIAVVHDLRHEERPADFSLPQRTFRRVHFGAAYRRADRLLAVSNRTAQTLYSRHPATTQRVRVVQLGSDHVPRRRSTREGAVVALGHYPNKVPNLLLEVWKILCLESVGFTKRLHVIGLGESQRETLAREAERLGVGEFVTLDPYISAVRYSEIMSCAAALLFPSQYEGFGLPVLEAMRQGVPVMISPDPALGETAAGHAARAVSWATKDLAVATQTALQLTDAEVAAAQRHSDQFTWQRTAELTRASVLAAMRGDRSDA